MTLTRRSALTGLAALSAAAALPARGQSAAYSAALDRGRSLDQFHAMVIVEDGEVALAEAVRGPSVETPVNVKSVSKSVVAALTGILIGEGALPGIDARLGDVAPGLIPSGAEDGVADITLEDLVTMRAGLERTSGENYGGWVSSGNWVADALSRPMVAEPGGRFLYSTGSFHILGAVLSEVSGESLLDLARTRLGAPLSIEIPPWTRDPAGPYMGGNNMALSPLAMARFGETYRNDGTWDGTRVIPEDWVSRSLDPRTRSPFSGDSYGYGWFLSQAAGTPVAYARGYGGQMIYVLPEARLTVAITSDPNRPARSRGYAGDLFRLLEETVLPEARDRMG